MRRLSKAVPVVLSLGLLCLFGVFAASCGSSGNAQVRVVDAISNSPALDVEVNTTKVFTNISFGAVMPAPPAYNGVPSGTVTLAAVNTGGTTSYINPANTTLSGSGHYTLLLAGTNAGIQAAAPAFYSISDNNTAPTTGNVEFRIINASVNLINLQGGLDIFIVQPGQQFGTPAVSGLTFGQGSAYVPENFNGAGYTVGITDSGQGQTFFTNTYQSPTGSIRTLVIVDSGNSINVLELNDLL